MKVLVTGAAGFIGFYLCKSLLEKGNSVIGIDNINDYYDINLKYARLSQLGISRVDAKQFSKICKSNTYDNSFCFVRMNLQDRELLPQLFKKEKFDVVVNLAAQAGVRYSLENPSSYVDSNLVGFLNVLECVRHFDVKHLLYASSSSVYGTNKKVPFSEKDDVNNPISLYAATKRSNELMAKTYSHLYDLSITGLRFFTVYGPWGRPDMAIYLFADAIAMKKPIKVFNKGNMKRDFTYINDIINGVEILLNNGLSNKKPFHKLYNVGNGNPESLFDFIKEIEFAFGENAEKVFLPMQAGDVPQTWSDVSNLKELGYKSETRIKEGIEKFVSWYKEYSGYSNE